MTAKKVIMVGLKIIAMTVIMFIFYSLASAVGSVQTAPEQDLEQTVKVAILLLVIYFVNTIVLAYPIIRACWSGLGMFSHMMVHFAI